MFGRGQLELGTDTVQCQGESNGQAEEPRDRSERGCSCGCLTKNTSDDDLENFAVCGGMRAGPAGIAGSGAITGAAVPESVERAKRAPAATYASGHAGDFAAWEGGGGRGRQCQRPDHQPERCGAGASGAGAGNPAG